MLTALLVSAALADEPAPEPAPSSEPLPTSSASTASVTGKKRQYLMEVNFRGRYMFLPDSALDIWYEKHAGEAFERPTVKAYALGLEYVIKDKQANGIFYAEYISSLMKEGYWDDRDNPPVTTDGSYIQPEAFGIIALGADYGYELHATDWLSFLFGGGLGVGIKTGRLVEWEPGEPEGTPDPDNTDQACGDTEAAYERVSHCADDGDVRVPPVVPVLDVNVGVRFNFSDRASLRIEGGTHPFPLIYGGGALGITF